VRSRRVPPDDAWRRLVGGEGPATLPRANVGVEEDFFAMVLFVDDWPVKPPALQYELVEATEEERAGLRAAGYRLG